MKKNLLKIFIILILFSTTLFPQIPNAGFENWTDGEPNGWISSNIPTFLTTVSQSTESHSGSSAVKLVFGSYFNQPYYGYLVAGDVQQNQAGFPVSQRYGSLRGYYKLDSSPNKILEIQLIFTRGENIIGTGFTHLSGNVPNYTDFTIPVGYLTAEIPDTALIYISYLDTAEIWTAGGGAYVDDLDFGEFVGIREIKSDQAPIAYELLQNYPNPFNPTTKISFVIPNEVRNLKDFSSQVPRNDNSHVVLMVYDVLGNEVATLVDEYKPVGSYEVEFNAANLPSGVYFYQLKAADFMSTKKMLLVK